MLNLTGSIAKLISSWRPQTLTLPSARGKGDSKTWLCLGNPWNAKCALLHTDVLLQDLPQLLKSLSIVESGDTIVITAGIPLKSVNSSNMLKINKIP